MHLQQNIPQHKMNRKKTKAKFSRLLQPVAWKRNGLILEEVDR